MKSVTTSWIVEGLFKSPRRPFSILTSGKTSAISLSPVRVGRPSLLAEVEKRALSRNACKITLEVLQNNAPARKAYQDVGFVPYELSPGAGVAEFWQKKL